MLQLPLGWTLLPQEPRSEISSLDVYGVWIVSEVGTSPPTSHTEHLKWAVGLELELNSEQKGSASQALKPRSTKEL